MSQSAKNLPTQEVRRRGWAKPLGTDATRLTDAALQRAGFFDPSLVLRWPDIAGQETAKLAYPVRCRMGPEGMVLTLKCEPGASVFLQHETRSLIERLNAFLGAGAVSRIRIVPGTLPPAKEPPAHARPNLPVPTGSQTGPQTGKSLANALDHLTNLRKELLRRPTP